MSKGVQLSCGIRRGSRLAGLLGVGLLLASLLGGCVRGPRLLSAGQQKLIDRKYVEYPASTELRLYAENLTAPNAITWDNEGSLLIAEGGVDDHQPCIYGFRRDGTFFQIWPKGRRLPLPLPGREFDIYGPIGGMVAAHGRIYISHRDRHDRGMITAFDYEGNHTTIVADLPAEGDYSVTDIAVHPNGRIYFGMGTATNSGVVGTDNLNWLRSHRNVCDQGYTNLYLLGRRFDTSNPFAGLFGGSDLAVTAPFQPFGKSIETFIPRDNRGKPNGAIYSVDPTGGDLRVEAFGIRNPVGLTFNEFGRLYMTNQGMKMRGTRPVKNDPDVLLKMVAGQWYGWPDFSADMLPIRDEQFQPDVDLIIKSGYRDLSFLIDHSSSRLSPPNRDMLLAAKFKPLAGAAKFDFAPPAGPFSKLRQNGSVAIVALSGDLAPYDTSGKKLIGPIGYSVVQANVETGQVKPFIHNTYEGPASRNGRDGVGLERPFDVKFGPDGALYVLDFGQLRMKGGKPEVAKGSGRIYKLGAIPEASGSEETK